MGIFSRSDRLPAKPSNATIIAAGTEIRGEIKGQCRVHVDGKFSGPINSNSIISVGKSGLVEGDVTAEKLIVTGSFSGTADCGEIQILAGGRVLGRITCSILVIERGGFFNGKNKLKELSPDMHARLGKARPLVALDNRPDRVTIISQGSKIVKTG